MLEVVKLSKSFGGLKAIRSFDMKINKNEIVGLIGPNGAGKTTAFNLITGTLKPGSGEIFFKGENIVGLKPYQVCKKGLTRTFQITRPFNNLSVLQNVMIGIFNTVNREEEAKKGASDLLKLVGLYGKRDYSANSLTIGDRKKLELVRCLATKPELLLLDEVMGGLNPTEVDEMLFLVRNLRENGVTILIIEHVMQAVMNLSDRIIVIHHGDKIAEGTPREVSNDQKVVDAYLGEEDNSA